MVPVTVQGPTLDPHCSPWWKWQCGSSVCQCRILMGLMGLVCDLLMSQDAMSAGFGFPNWFLLFVAAVVG
jgi:hypothetical protein